MTPGKNLFEAFSGELGFLFFLVVIVVLIILAAKKEWTKAIGFLVGAMILSVVIFTPEKLKDLGLKLWTIVFG